MLEQIPRRFCLTYPRIRVDGSEVIRVRCAWCGEPKDGLGPIKTGEKISDGICKKCLAEVRAESPYFRKRRGSYDQD